MKLLAPDSRGIERAALALAEGDLVAFPTETVYGLGAVAVSDRAVARIFAAKQRPAHNPLIAHVASRQAAGVFAEFDARAEELAERFWPGPLTLVLRLKVQSPISRLVTAGLDTIAVRVPSHPVARELLRRVEIPVAAPSANRSGSMSPTRPEHVADSLGHQVNYLLDGGQAGMGLESTVVDLSHEAEPGILLRPGSLTRESVEAIIGPLSWPEIGNQLRAPGMLQRHYAPSKPIRINADKARTDEAVLGFAGQSISGAAVSRDLSPNGDLAEAATNLYAMLWELDAGPAAGIAVLPIPEHGLGEAINDRLRRAACTADEPAWREPAL